jgi:hypothetical protein
MSWQSKAQYVAQVQQRTGGGALALVTIVYDSFGNKVAEGIEEEGQKLLDDAIDIGALLVDSIADVSVKVANAALDVIEGAGLAVISAGESMFDYTYSKVAPHRVEAVTALTALTIYLTTAVIVFKKIRGVN